MATLLMRLAGPMQAWGTQSRFSIRDAGTEPSKSGVIGLLCAALGRPRSAPVDDLVALRMGVRVDREGAVKVDYQTAGGAHESGHSYGVAKADGSTPGTVTSQRYYLADASFLVGLEGDETLLRRLDEALAMPRWQLYLGRKACIPGEPIRLPDVPPWGPGLRVGSLEDALSQYPGLPRNRERDAESLPVRVVMDTNERTGSDVRGDVPLSFEDRTFGKRTVRTTWITPPPGGD